MKSYNNLYESCITDENIRLAIGNAFSGKLKKRKDVIEILNNLDDYVVHIRYYFTHYENKKHKVKRIYDGISKKVREIIVPSVDELVVQHILINVLKPMLMNGMYKYSFASIPGKGALKGKYAVERFLRNPGKDAKYYLKMDIHHFFNSIPHDILKAKLSKSIRDKKLLEVLFKIIDVVEVGLPLGFYTSQWLANWYLTSLDHYIKEVLKVKSYYRYMDDMVIFGSNKRRLHQVRQCIQSYLDNYGLKLKSNYQVVRFDYNDKYHFLDFMGYKFYRNRTTIRKSIICRSRRKANRISKKPKPTIYDCRSMLSYKGYYKYTNTKMYFNKYIKPKVSFDQLSKIISIYDKRRITYGMVS